jgi:hydroxypyruvate isomerase
MILPKLFISALKKYLMLNFSANLWYLFQEWKMIDRFSVCARAGFRAVEFHFPYKWPANILAQKLAENDLKQVLINAPAGNWEGGERGIAGLPGRQSEFQESIGLALEYAIALDCPNLHVMAGLNGDRDVFAENISYAAEICSFKKIRVLIEPLNLTDVPGYLIANTQDALAVLKIVNHKNLLLQYDIYHGILNKDDVLLTIQDNLSVIGHIQVAGVPGRHEPDSKAGFDFKSLFYSIEKMDYMGWIGCEYTPRAGTVNGLNWAKDFGIT